jgi:hypothetical protein
LRLANRVAVDAAWLVAEHQPKEQAMILLGFEIFTGRKVEIPELGHLAWFGQTQLSGKTTALEAIAFRGHLRAIAFITKQGEGGFLTGHLIPPYFSEPTNDEEQPLWRWVKSILEASQQRRMNFEESWIIRACEDPCPAETLADVHRNIKDLLAGQSEMVMKRGKKKPEWKVIRKPVTGMNAGIYTSLKAYFDIVMPQLARLPYTKKLELGPGLNVMDLRGYAMETQALVIRSVMEWVYQHEKNVRVIVPEAQDFVPQGKNSPVKMACETLVRKAGANKNFMWLDSQDMAAVDKFALRACSIVGIGVQTEMHEIDRSLGTMFSPALRPVDIARLRIGEFFVRTPQAQVVKVYVQPAWMDSELHAQEIAKGNQRAEDARSMLEAFKRRQQKGQPPAPSLQQLQIQEPPEDAEETPEKLPYETPALGVGIIPVLPLKEEAMWKEQYELLKTENEQLKTEHRNLIQAHDALAREVKRLSKLLNERQAHAAREHGVVLPATEGNGHEPGRETADFVSLEKIYDYIKARAANDPGVLELLTRQPELRVKVERTVISMDGHKMDGQLARLIHEGFFDQPRDRAAIGEQLRRRAVLATTANLKILSPYLHKLTELGFLVKEEGGNAFRALEGMKVSIV